MDIWSAKQIRFALHYAPNIDIHILYNRRALFVSVLTCVPLSPGGFQSSVCNAEPSPRHHLCADRKAEFGRKGMPAHTRSRAGASSVQLGAKHHTPPHLSSQVNHTPLHSQVTHTHLISSNSLYSFLCSYVQSYKALSHLKWGLTCTQSRLITKYFKHWFEFMQNSILCRRISNCSRYCTYTSLHSKQLHLKYLERCEWYLWSTLLHNFYSRFILFDCVINVFPQMDYKCHGRQGVCLIIVCFLRIIFNQVIPPEIDKEMTK